MSGGIKRGMMSGGISEESNPEEDRKVRGNLNQLKEMEMALLQRLSLMKETMPWSSPKRRVYFSCMRHCILTGMRSGRVVLSKKGN